MTLRFARPEDAEALSEIYRPYVEETSISFETEAPSAEEFRQRILEISARFPYLVAETDGVILGFAYAHPYHQRAAFLWSVESSVYVRQDIRGRHVGRALYGALLPLLEAMGVRNVCAVITIPNEPSIAFHKAMGFTAGGLLEDFGYKLGKWHSVAYLCRRLGPSGTAPAPLRAIGELDPALTRNCLENAR